MGLFDAKSKIRKSVIILASCGILFNFLFDFFAFRELHDLDENGRAVAQTYETTIHLQNLDRAIELYLLNPTSPTQKSRVTDEISTAAPLLKDSRQQALLKDLVEEIGKPNESGKAADIVAEILALESQQLKNSLQGDLRENQKLERSMINALILDGFIVSLLLYLFSIELKRRRQIESNLISSLNYLREANMTLKEDQIRKQISVNTTVHDLKNPLGAIRGFAEIMSNELPTLPNVQEFSQIIKRISQNSLELVENLLAKSQNTSVEMDTIDLIEIANIVYQQNGIQALSKSQNLVSDFKISTAPFFGSRFRLEELFSNLLSNAIKYSPRNATICFRAFRAEEFYQFEVEDGGPGFSREDKEKAFQYGQKLSAKPTGNETSTGYGLFVVKQIVDLHKGTIAISDAESGQGARVIVRLKMNLRDKMSFEPAPTI